MTDEPTATADDGVRVYLRWERIQTGNFFGYSGKLVAAMVICRAVDNPDRRWIWTVEMNTKYICQGRGETVSAAASRRAAERAWGKWLAYAGLAPSPRPASE